jgi:peptidoglycan/LPS O-acetylase OafA/YrhL
MALVDNHPEQGVKAEVGYIDTIEGLRGVAVLWVVCFHHLALREAQSADPWNAAVASSYPVHVILGNGYLGVDLFFLITGFLLILPWARHREEGKSAPRARDFYVRRLRRIVPAYYVQLFLLFFLFVPLLRGWEYLQLDATHLLENALAHATFLHFTTPLTSASLSINGALWSLALEFQYYLLLPLLAPVFVRAPLLSALALIAATGAWRWLAQNDMESLVRFEMSLGARWDVPEISIRHLLTSQLPGYLAHFAAGILAGLGWYRWRHRASTGLELAGWLLAGACALAALYWTYAESGMPRDSLWILTVPLFGIAMFAVVSRGGAPARLLLGKGPLSFVGRISYSMYLYHLPLLLVWNRYATFRESWWSFPAYLLCVVLVSWLSYRFVESPFLRKASA